MMWGRTEVSWGGVFLAMTCLSERFEWRMLRAPKITHRTHAHRGESLVGARGELPLLVMLLSCRFSPSLWYSSHPGFSISPFSVATWCFPRKFFCGSDLLVHMVLQGQDWHIAKSYLERMGFNVCTRLDLWVEVRKATIFQIGFLTPQDKQQCQVFCCRRNHHAVGTSSPARLHQF